MPCLYLKIVPLFSNTTEDFFPSFSFWISQLVWTEIWRLVHTKSFIPIYFIHFYPFGKRPCLHLIIAPLFSKPLSLEDFFGGVSQLVRTGMWKLVHTKSFIPVYLIHSFWKKALFTLQSCPDHWGFFFSGCPSWFELGFEDLFTQKYSSLFISYTSFGNKALWTLENCPTFFKYHW